MNNDVEYFKNTDNGVVITQEGIKLQKNLRETSNRNDHSYKTMTRLVPVKKFEEYKDLVLSFGAEQAYYNSGIYVYSNGKWIFYYPFKHKNTTKLSKINEDYKIINLKNSENYYETKESLHNIKDQLDIPLSEILTLLNEEAKSLNTKFNVYLNACNYGKLTNNLIEENKELFNRRRNNTIKYNKTLNNSKKSGVTKNNTRTLHLSQNFFTNKYFNLNYNKLPVKDKRELLPKFGISSETQWHNKRDNTNFQIQYKSIHSRFNLGEGKDKIYKNMTPEEQQATEVLGYKNNKNWNTNINGKTKYLQFSNLSTEQKKAARLLGFEEGENVPVIPM